MPETPTTNTNKPKKKKETPTTTILELAMQTLSVKHRAENIPPLSINISNLIT